MVEWTSTSGPITSESGGVNDFGTQRSQHYKLIHHTGVNASTIMVGRFHPFIGHKGPQGEQRYSSTLFLTPALEGREGSASCPGHILPPGKTRYPLHKRLGGPQGRSGQVWKISPPPGFDPRTVQPVRSCYVDYTTRPTSAIMRQWKWLFKNGCKHNSLISAMTEFVNLCQDEINASMCSGIMLKNDVSSLEYMSYFQFC